MKSPGFVPFAVERVDRLTVVVAVGLSEGEVFKELFLNSVLTSAFGSIFGVDNAGPPTTSTSWCDGPSFLIGVAFASKFGRCALRTFGCCRRLGGVTLERLWITPEGTATSRCSGSLFLNASDTVSDEMSSKLPKKLWYGCTGNDGFKSVVETVSNDDSSVSGQNFGNVWSLRVDDIIVHSGGVLTSK